MEPKVTFDGESITIRANGMLDSMSKEDRLHFISRILFDDEVLEMLLEMVVENNNQCNGGWHNPDTISDIRDKLLPVMPEIVKSHVATLRATARADSRRAKEYRDEMYAWRRMADILAQWVVTESKIEPRDLEGTSYAIKCRAAKALEPRFYRGIEIERLVQHARADERYMAEQKAKEAKEHERAG